MTYLKVATILLLGFSLAVFVVADESHVSNPPSNLLTYLLQFVKTLLDRLLQTVFALLGHVPIISSILEPVQKLWNSIYHGL
ncbi:unnamed protein product [Ceutorhynchus assimilis]|uniref:Uncharacterized protein n=1 Tax=Ceutorhynchus assimilis TaxID=467358 RepID=A0A9N9MPK0_9CUCU|nr:unnamed protein product [Ceutorhynchus assimilis]